jgi:hypothetical protein
MKISPNSYSLPPACPLCYLVRYRLFCIEVLDPVFGMIEEREERLRRAADADNSVLCLILTIV